MRPERKRDPAFPATWRRMIALAVVVALALILFWAGRDGLEWGDVLGGLVIGVLTFATLVALSRLRRS